jgi:hypothetical protein
MALSLAAGLSTLSDVPQDLVTDLKGFAVEDDASPEWQHIIDLTGMLVDCLGGMPLVDNLETALSAFLDSQMNALGDELGARNAAELHDLLASDPRWTRTVAWVDSL